MKYKVTPFGPEVEEKKFITIFCVYSSLFFIVTLLIPALAIWALISYRKEDNNRVPPLSYLSITVMVLSPILIVIVLVIMFFNWIYLNFSVFAISLELATIIGLSLNAYMALILNRLIGDGNPIDAYRNLTNVVNQIQQPQEERIESGVDPEDRSR